MCAVPVDSLRAAFQGEIFQPADTGYDAARKIWNASIDKHPAIIARCSGTADVMAAVAFAREHNLLTAIRGGGHNVGGRALCDDGLVIDLSRLRGVFVDPNARTVRVQGGVTLGDLDRETHVYGLAVPTGVVPKTGIAGLTLGGGVGFLIRKYGMTIDNLLSCQVATADGKLITASAAEHDDLFWALRGGGGNFGVVTSFEFRAHPVHTVMGGLILYSRTDSRDVLRHFRDYIITAPDELTAYAVFLSTPDGHPATAIAVCYCGDPAESDTVLNPLRHFGTPLADLVGPMTFPAMQSLFAPAFPDGMHNYWKSSLLAQLSGEAIDVTIESANQMRSPLSALVLEYYGGAAARVSNDATAFPHRNLPWDIIIAAQWPNPAESSGHRNWARATAEALRPFGPEAHLLSILDADDAVKSSFGANLTRLAAVKAKYDPDNFFRVNANISPAKS